MNIVLDTRTKKKIKKSIYLAYVTDANKRGIISNKLFEAFKITLEEDFPEDE